MADYIDIHPIITLDGEPALWIKDDRGEAAGDVGTWVESPDGSRFLRIHRDSVRQFDGNKTREVAEL